MYLSCQLVVRPQKISILMIFLVILPRIALGLHIQANYIMSLYLLYITVLYHQYSLKVMLLIRNFLHKWLVNQHYAKEYFEHLAISCHYFKSLEHIWKLLWLDPYVNYPLQSLLQNSPLQLELYSLYQILCLL